MKPLATVLTATLAAASAWSCASPEQELDLGSELDDGELVRERIDRMGHVEVGPLLITADSPAADPFNREAAFSLGISPEDEAMYRDAITAGLIKYDHYDSERRYENFLDSFGLGILDDIQGILEGVLDRGAEPVGDELDWIDHLDTPHPLLEVYLTDALIVDVSKPCSSSTFVPGGAATLGGYMEIEMAVLRDEEVTSCGGRMPNEDVIDKMATLLINGPENRPIELEGDDPYPDRGDFVTEPARPASGEFPYLAEPYTRFLFQ